MGSVDGVDRDEERDQFKVVGRCLLLVRFMGVEVKNSENYWNRVDSEGNRVV